ncbi:MAG: hypothetical protein Q7T73_04560 [Beijerinckiaceae bacterium]|nr:hypothetical protein [Beijerinckiaceae bacterium]
MRNLLAGAALSVMLLPAMAGSAFAACAGSSFITSGCFSSYTAFVPYPNDTDGLAANPGYITLQSSAANATLSLLGASSAINYVTLSFAGTTAPGSAGAPAVTANQFTLTVLGSNGTLFSPISGTNVSIAGYQTVTFFSAVGIAAGQNLNFQTVGLLPSYAQLGQITVAAPAPLAGAGLLSFLGMGFAGMMRRGRSFMTSFRAKRRAIELA